MPNLMSLPDDIFVEIGSLIDEWAKRSLASTSKRLCDARLRVRPTRPRTLYLDYSSRKAARWHAARPR